MAGRQVKVKLLLLLIVCYILLCILYTMHDHFASKAFD
jgi:hypothetical protein